MPAFNFGTMLYEGNERKFEAYSDARKIKWKCEKCSETFQSYKLLHQQFSQDQNFSGIYKNANQELISRRQARLLIWQ